jgi:hypothetical protein
MGKKRQARGLFVPATVKGIIFEVDGLEIDGLYIDRFLSINEADRIRSWI